MLQININTQPIRLEYSSQNAQLNLHSTPPLLQMETIPPVMEIHQPRGELTIDQTPCRYSIGLKNNTDFEHDYASLSRQAAMEGLARIVAEGHRLGQITNKTNAIAEIAADSTRSEVPGITWAYIESPDIHYQANQVQFNPIDGKINFTFQPGTVQGDYQRGSIDIRVIQYPNIKMSTVDVKV